MCSRFFRSFSLHWRWRVLFLTHRPGPVRITCRKLGPASATCDAEVCRHSRAKMRLCRDSPGVPTRLRPSPVPDRQLRPPTPPATRPSRGRAPPSWRESAPSLTTCFLLSPTLPPILATKENLAPLIGYAPIDPWFFYVHPLSPSVILSLPPPSPSLPLPPSVRLLVRQVLNLLGGKEAHLV